MVKKETEKWKFFQMQIKQDPGSINDRKSTSGYCTRLWGNLVTQHNKKKSVVARSSTEAEYKAMTYGICEAIWLKQLLEELRISL